MSDLKMRLATAALALLMSGGAMAGECQVAIDRQNKWEAEDAAHPPGYWEQFGTTQVEHDAAMRSMKNNVIIGCMPGGIYDQLDKVIRQIEETCKAHPDIKDCG